MIQAKCLKKYRDKNDRIIGYLLQDINGNTREYIDETDASLAGRYVKCVNGGVAALKKQIHDGIINVVDLTLTSDNRLVDASAESFEAGMKAAAAQKAAQNKGQMAQMAQMSTLSKNLKVVAILRFSDHGEITKTDKESTMGGLIVGYAVENCSSSDIKFNRTIKKVDSEGRQVYSHTESCIKAGKGAVMRREDLVALVSDPAYAFMVSNGKFIRTRNDLGTDATQRMLSGYTFIPYVGTTADLRNIQVGVSMSVGADASWTVDLKYRTLFFDAVVKLAMADGRWNGSIK